MSDLDMELLRDFAQATYEKQEAEKIAKARKKKLDELDEQIRSMLSEAGVPSIPVTIKARNVKAEAIEIVSHFKDQLTPEGIVGALAESGLLAQSTPEYTKTIFIGSRIWAKPVPTGADENGDPIVTDEDYERACEVLRQHGFGDYVQTRFNIISLSSAVKEDVENGVIPTGSDYFDGAIHVEEKFEVRTRARR